MKAMKLGALVVGLVMASFPAHAEEIPIIPRVAKRLSIPERKVEDYFSEKLILKKPLGDLKEWSGEFDVEEGDSDRFSKVTIRFEKSVDKKSGKITWTTSGKVVEDIVKHKTTPFKEVSVMILDEDGSAFFKIGERRCYLFRHKTEGCILIVEDGFYIKSTDKEEEPEPQSTIK